MLEIIIDDRNIRRAFATLRQATSDLSAPMADIGETYTRKIDNQFRKEIDPYGNRWTALSSKTLKRKLKAKPRQISKILQATGLLRASFSYTASRTEVEIGSNRVGRNGIPLGLIHQKGSRNIPKRQLLPEADQGLPPADLREIVAIIEDHIQDAWG